MPAFIACLDAAYSATSASAACALFSHWEAPAATRILTWRQEAAAAYEPGSFYKREMPLLLAVLGQAEQLPEIIIVDGYVWLDGHGRPGLGAMLHKAFDERIAVIGVAKTRFGDASSWCTPVLRGASKRPLYVSAAGMAMEDAAQHVQSMHGAHRIPTLLQVVDRAARSALA